MYINYQNFIKIQNIYFYKNLTKREYNINQYSNIEKIQE